MSEHTPRATLFYLTEPSRDVFIVNFRIGAELKRLEITRDQLRNFLVDGTAMALRSEQKKDLIQATTAASDESRDHQTSEAI